MVAEGENEMDLRVLRIPKFDDVLCGGRGRVMNEIGKIPSWF